VLAYATGRMAGLTSCFKLFVSVKEAPGIEPDTAIGRTQRCQCPHKVAGRESRKCVRIRCSHMPQAKLRGLRNSVSVLFALAMRA
jgi:hypothetical protein